MYKHSLTKSFLYPLLIFSWRIEKCFCRDWWYWWHYDRWQFLSDVRNIAKSFENCALFRLCGQTSPKPASFEKQKLLPRSRPGAAPSPRPSAALTHQSFVNIRTRLFQRGKVKAQFPCLTYITKSFLLPLIFPWKIEKCMPISEFHIKILMLEWMIDAEYLSGKHIYKNNFDKVWQN